MNNTNEFAAREAAIGPNILLASGVYFHFDEPARTTVCVEDVAHALSNLCRFTGHSRQFYSVAQHAVLVSHLVPPDLAYQALHHDDVEAVMGDVSSPLKKLLPEYKKLERKIEEVILFQMGILSPMPDAVKRADLIALRTEQRDLMPAIGGSWQSLDGIDPADQVIVPMAPAAARAAYLRRHEELWPEYAARQGLFAQAPNLCADEQTPVQPEPIDQAAHSEPVGVLSVYMYEHDAGEIFKASSISEIWESVEKLPLGTYQLFIRNADSTRDCSCPSGDGSLRWPCPVHPALPKPAYPAQFNGHGGEQSSHDGYSTTQMLDYAAQTVAAQAPVLDSDWRSRMLDGTAIERDDMGCGEHSALPMLEEGMKPKQFFDALGIELQCVMAEDQMDMDAYEAMIEATDYNVWTPSAPDGEGWRQVAIFDTEDGPACWWIREALPSPRMRHARTTPTAVAVPDSWHQAILDACMATEACYVAGDAKASLDNLIDWHIDNERRDPAKVQAEPVIYVSRGQLDNFANPEHDGGHYLPVRRTPVGLLSYPLYAGPQATQAEPADALPATPPKSNTLWRLLTNGYDWDYVTSGHLSERDRSVLETRAKGTWAAICTEANPKAAARVTTTGKGQIDG